jgi:Fur family ferric uptake transcriptional regulator
MTDKKPRRNTRQRQVVLAELKKLTSHPTAAELHEFARRRLPTISLGTVYRNLELLAARGTIQKLEYSNESRFDGNPDRHPHVRCVRCGRVDDVHGLSAHSLKTKFKTLNGYEILGYRLEFLGLCPACRDATPKDDETPPHEKG